MQPSIPPDNVQPLTALERSSSLDTPPEPAQQTPFEPEDSDGGAESVRAAAAEQQTRRFLQATLDALTSHVAVIDAEGTILAVNKAWQRFAEANQGKAHVWGRRQLFWCLPTVIRRVDTGGDRDRSGDPRGDDRLSTVLC